MAYAGLAAGAAILVAVLAFHDLHDVGTALATAGIGLAAVALFHLVPIALDALAWRALFPPGERGPARTFVLARWICFSVNSLLPVMQVGGNVARARLLARRGVVPARAWASVVVDLTTLTGSQVLFALAGLLVLLAHIGRATPVLPLLVAIGPMAIVVAMFFLAQRRGLFGGAMRLLERALGGRRDRLAEGADALDASVREFHATPRALVVSIAWHLASWLAGVCEAWITLALLGRPTDFTTAFLIESLGHMVRSSAFVMPGALGVQEAGYALLGRALGLGPETAIALSLAQRVRDVLLGIPGLIAWWSDGAEVVRHAAPEHAREA